MKAALAAALAEYERLGRYLVSLDGEGLERVAKVAGLRLVRDDEATVERVAKALYELNYRGENAWENEPVPRWKDEWRSWARTALTAAQGGKDG